MNNDEDQTATPPPPVELSQAWETPVPLTEIPSAGAFPVDVLPPVLAGLTQQIAAALHCPTDCIGPVLLALAASAIGASQALDLHPHCREFPALYLAVILPRGLTLTSVLQILAEPIFQIQAQWLGLRRQTPDEIQRQLDEWIHSCSQNDPFEEAEDESLALGQDEWAKLKRWFATDATASALAVVLKDNPRGLLVLRDDLAPWLKLLDAESLRRIVLRQKDVLGQFCPGTEPIVRPYAI